MNDTQLQSFDFENQKLIIKIINDKEYFLAKSVCDILELENVSQAISKIEKDDIILNDTMDNIGRLQKANYVNEAGLYALIFQSRKTEAKKFKKWVFNEVLPSIRKTGNYDIKKELTQDEQMLLLAQNVIKQIEENQKLKIENTQQEEVIKEYIAIEHNKNYTEIAKSLHLKPNKFIEELRVKGYIGKKNIPHQEYINKKFFTIKKTTRDIGGEVKHFESYLVTPVGYQYFFRKVKNGEFDNIKI